MKLIAQFPESVALMTRETVDPDEIGVIIVSYEIAGDCYGAVFVPVSIRGEAIDVPGDGGDRVARIMQRGRHYGHAPGTPLQFKMPRALGPGADALAALVLVDGPRTKPNHPEIFDLERLVATIEGNPSTAIAEDNPVDRELAEAVEVLFRVSHSMKQEFVHALVYP